jgi:homoserine O-acetyltransferase
MYFPLTDAEYESQFIPNVELHPIPSVWGHAAGGGPTEDERRFISEQIRRALRGQAP